MPQLWRGSRVKLLLIEASEDPAERFILRVVEKPRPLKVMFSDCSLSRMFKTLTKI